MHEFLHFSFEQLGHRDSGPAADDFRDVFFVHFFLEESLRPLLLSQPLFLGSELALEFRETPITQLSSAV